MPMSEQRNAYKGTPPRPWIRISLVAADGETRELDVLADTGNPCALIIGMTLLQQFQVLAAPGVSTNFGDLAGGWLRIHIPDIGLEEEILAYGGDAVAGAVAASHADFEGLAGLPLLRMMEYGGDRHEFWIQNQS
jgi:hypothetical protein